MLAVKFEVFGKVQKVFFRKHTAGKAQALGLHGWCMNTPHGTVVGEMEGPAEAIAQMKTWLSTEGSPQSRIDRAEFNDEREITAFSQPPFDIRR